MYLLKWSVGIVATQCLQIALRCYNAEQYFRPLWLKRGWLTWCNFKRVNFSQTDNISHCHLKIRSFCTTVKYEHTSSSHLGAILFEESMWPSLLHIKGTGKKSNNFSTRLCSLGELVLTGWKEKIFVIAWNCPHQQKKFWPSLRSFRLSDVIRRTLACSRCAPRAAQQAHGLYLWLEGCELAQPQLCP